MTGKTPMEKALLDAVEGAVELVRPEAGRQIKTRMFYPYIADSSFMAVGGDPSTVDDLNDNMPSSKYKYFHDISKIREIDVPVVNIGTFGRDGHMVHAEQIADAKHDNVGDNGIHDALDAACNGVEQLLDAAENDTEQTFTLKHNTSS